MVRDLGMKGLGTGEGCCGVAEKPTEIWGGFGDGG